MARKLILPVLLATALLSAAVTTLWRGLPWWRERQLIHRAERVGVALETHRQRHGCYPGSLAETGIAEPAELYYRREDNGSYILWFGTTLGESVTFRSAERSRR